MQLLDGGGLREVERLVRELNAHGSAFAAAERGARFRRWTERLTRERELWLQVSRDRLVRTTSIGYRAVPVATLTTRQQRMKAVQNAFYGRYMAAGRVAYADPPGRLRRHDRLVLLVGELEADVSNGGFAQYLLNKGARRARAALRVLELVGARKTATMLRRAIAAGESSPLLAKLDAQFYRTAEDLPTLTMRHVSA